MNRFLVLLCTLAIASLLKAEDLVHYKIPGDSSIMLQPSFSIYDDDALDKIIPSSHILGNSGYGGYASIYFPLLQSLGIRGAISMEGQRVGFTDSIPILNANGEIIQQLQNTFDWEISCHTMTARFVSNIYEVDSINSTLADKILLASSNRKDYKSSSTTMIFDRQTSTNYYAKKNKSGWDIVPREYIRPYLMDYNTGKVHRYNPTFPIDYQWNRFVEIADSLGFCIETGVLPANTGSHAVWNTVNRIIPHLFDITNSTSKINTPPLSSFVNRYQLDHGNGQNETNNTYDSTFYHRVCQAIDDTKKCHGWLVFFMHAYRPCWINAIDSALVSHGGTYPDEWVLPICETDDVISALSNPPARLGIKDWTDWYPCPGTRLCMAWDILRYALDAGVTAVLPREGFDIFANKQSEGFFAKGGQSGQNMYYIEGTSQNYKHHYIGINNSEDFYGIIESTTTRTNTNKYSIYSITGQHVTRVQHGVNIIMHENGVVTKILK